MVKIFVSSTSQDLAEHRQAVIDVLRKANHQPIAMETFGSKAGDAQQVSLKEVEKADLFMGIYARRYGYRPTDDKSVTEMEYLHAKEKGIDCLVFIVDDAYAHPLVDQYAETDDEAKVFLKSFIRRLNKENVRTLFTAPDDLAQKALLALTNWLSDRMQGQIVDSSKSEQSKSEQTMIHNEIKGDNYGSTFNAPITTGDNANFGSTNTFGNKKKKR